MVSTLIRPTATAVPALELVGQLLLMAGGARLPSRRQGAPLDS